MADDAATTRAQIAAQIQARVTAAAPADPLASARARYPGYTYVPGAVVLDTVSGQSATVIYAHRRTFHGTPAQPKAG